MVRTMERVGAIYIAMGPDHHPDGLAQHRLPCLRYGIVPVVSQSPNEPQRLANRHAYPESAPGANDGQVRGASTPEQISEAVEFFMETLEFVLFAKVAQLGLLAVQYFVDILFHDMERP